MDKDQGERELRARQAYELIGAFGGDPLLAPGQVAKIFFVDPRTVTRWAKAGKLKSVKTLGGQVRFKWSDIRAAIEEREAA